MVRWSRGRALGNGLHPGLASCPSGGPPGHLGDLDNLGGLSAKSRSQEEFGTPETWPHAAFSFAGMRNVLFAGFPFLELCQELFMMG